MQKVKKVVLAYSGGVDTSVCIHLKNEYGISELLLLWPILVKETT